MKITVKIAAIIMAATLAAFPAYAQKPPASFEEKAVKAFLLYCLPAITNGDSVARIAEMSKLPELNASAQSAFLQGKPGKVFALPEVGPGIVLAAPDKPLCLVMIKEFNEQEFLHQTEFWFADGESPFHLKVDKTDPDGSIHREYEAQVKDSHLLLLLNARPAAMPGGLQGLLTLGRTQ